jgi:acyl-coenzyme A thioesterase PaaI-like protein
VTAEGHTETTHATHILSELGHAVRHDGDDLLVTASVSPEMHAPETAHLRTSILAVWADILAGLLAAETWSPRVPVTLELDVHLHRPAPGTGALRGTARTLKAGRTVFVASIEFAAADGQPIALAAATFMSAPDPALSLPPKLSIELPASPNRLTMPFAERAGCARRGPGVAVLPRSEDGLNSSNTVNGGLIALVAEEAALSLAPGTTLSSLGLRYLQPVRKGPLVANAHLHDGLGQVLLCDSGNDDRLSAVATTRTFAPGA